MAFQRLVESKKFARVWISKTWNSQTNGSEGSGEDPRRMIYDNGTMSGLESRLRAPFQMRFKLLHVARNFTANFGCFEYCIRIKGMEILFPSFYSNCLIYKWSMIMWIGSLVNLSIILCRLLSIVGEIQIYLNFREDEWYEQFAWKLIKLVSMN